MQRDAWYSSMRAAGELASPEAVGRYAAERALSRLKSRKISTRECPVLFESPLAAGLLGGYVQATSGGSLYRKSTFLLDSWASRCSPTTSTWSKTRTCAAARAALLRRGRRAHRARKVVDAGVRARATSSAATRRASWA